MADARAAFVVHVRVATVSLYIVYRGEELRLTASKQQISICLGSVDASNFVFERYLYSVSEPQDS